MTRVHITADKEVWTGASTTACLAAEGDAAAVVVSAGDDAVLQRFKRRGVEVIKCPMSGLFATVNLSRALRHIPGKALEVYVHSPKKMQTVEAAIKLVGRDEEIILHPTLPPVEFPAIAVEKPDESKPPIIMWLGNITESCGLRELIEEAGQLTEKPWRLRIVGEGKAKIVSPILKRTRALGIADRIEWVGYSDNPFKQMNGVAAAIVTKPDSIVAKEFAAASIHVYNKLSDIDL